MKKKLKKLFYLSLLLSGLIIVGCELQEYIIEQHNHQHKLKLSQKRFSELLQDKNFTTAFSKIPKQKILTTNILGRTQIEEKYGFTIFDTPVNVFESDTLIAYNLLIKRDIVSEGSYVENLVMNIFPQKNRTDAYIIKYVFDGTTEINPENFFELEKKHVVTPVIFNSEPFDEADKQGMACIRLLEFQCCILGGKYKTCHTPDSVECVGNWMTVDVICNTSAGSGGGFDYSGVGGGPPDPHQGGSNGNGNTHPVYNNPAPPCDPRVNCPVLEDTMVENTPCEKLKKLFAPSPIGPNIKSIIENELQTNIPVNPSGEKGALLRRNSGGGTGHIIIPPTDKNMIKITAGGYVYSAIHTHPNDTYPMFTWSDVFTLYTINQNIAPHNAELASFLLTCQDENGAFQTYAIVFNNQTADIVDMILNSPEFAGMEKNKIAELKDDELTEKFISEEKGDKNYERAFLQQMLNTNVSLYKANNDLTNWSRLELNTTTDNTVDIPCN